MQAVRMVMPFSNEVANVLTSSGLAIFSGLYRDVPKTKNQQLSKVLIDLVALIGIILNAVYVTHKYGQTAGIVKGVIVILIAFVIPNLTFHRIIKKVCYRCSKWQKIFFGLLLIGGLTGLEFAFDHFLVELVHEEEEKVVVVEEEVVETTE